MTVRVRGDTRPVDALPQREVRRRRRAERWKRLASRIANAFGLVLLLVVATYVLGSLTTFGGWGSVATVTVASASVVAAFASTGVPTKVIRGTAVVGIAAVICAAATATSGEAAPLGVSALLVALMLFAATSTLLRGVVAQREVGYRTILGAISVYIMFGLLFTFLYAALDRLQAGAFFATETAQRTGDFLFFSITTLTTTGYGNLVPAAQPGKLFAGLEMLVGQIFLVTFIAGLVSLWRPRRQPETDAANR